MHWVQMIRKLCQALAQLCVWYFAVKLQPVSLPDYRNCFPPTGLQGSCLDWMKNSLQQNLLTSVGGFIFVSVILKCGAPYSQAEVAAQLQVGLSSAYLQQGSQHD